MSDDDTLQDQDALIDDDTGSSSLGEGEDYRVVDVERHRRDELDDNESEAELNEVNNRTGHESDSDSSDRPEGLRSGRRNDFTNGDGNDSQDGIYADDGNSSSVESAHRADHHHKAGGKIGQEQQAQPGSHSDDGIYDDDDSETASDKDMAKAADKETEDGIYADDGSDSSSDSDGAKQPEGGDQATTRNDDSSSEGTYEDDFNDADAKEAQTANEDAKQEKGDNRSEEESTTGRKSESVSKREESESSKVATVSGSASPHADQDVPQRDTRAANPSEANQVSAQPCEQNLVEGEVTAPGPTEASKERHAEDPMLALFAEAEKAYRPSKPDLGSQVTELDSAEATASKGNAEAATSQDDSAAQAAVPEAGHETEPNAVAKRLAEHFLGGSEHDLDRSADSVASRREGDEDAVEAVDPQRSNSPDTSEMVEGEVGESAAKDAVGGEEGVFAEAQRADNAGAATTVAEGAPAVPNVVVTVKSATPEEEDIVYVDPEEARELLGVGEERPQASGAQDGEATPREAEEEDDTRPPASSAAHRKAGVRRPGSSWVEYTTRVHAERSRASSGKRGGRKEAAAREERSEERGGGGGRRRGREGGRGSRGGSRSKSRESVKARPEWNSRLFLPARLRSDHKHEHILRWVPPPTEGGAQVHQSPSFEYPAGVSPEPSRPGLGEKSRTRLGRDKDGGGVQRSQSSLSLSAASPPPSKRRPATSLGTASTTQLGEPPAPSPSRPEHFQYNTEGLRGGKFGSGARRDGGGCRKTEIEERAQAARALPGPHTYQVRREDSTPEHGGVMAGRLHGPGSMDWTLHRSAMLPGPTQYDADGRPRRRVLGGRISSARIKSEWDHVHLHARSRPAPTDYDPGPSQPRRVRGGAIQEGKVLGEEDVRLLRAARTPGPGQYNLPPLGHVHGGGFSGARRLDDKPQGKSSGPGPGSYSVGGTPTQSTTSVGLRSKSLASLAQRSSSTTGALEPYNPGHRVTVFDMHMSKARNLPGPATYDADRHALGKKVERKPMLVGRGNWPAPQTRGWSDPVVYRVDGDICSVNADRRAIHALQRNWEASAQHFAAMLKAAGVSPTAQQPPPPQAFQQGTAEPLDDAGHAATRGAAADETAGVAEREGRRLEEQGSLTLEDLQPQRLPSPPSSAPAASADAAAPQPQSAQLQTDPPQTCQDPDPPSPPPPTSGAPPGHSSPPQDPPPSASPPSAPEQSPQPPPAAPDKHSPQGGIENPSAGSGVGEAAAGVGSGPAAPVQVEAPPRTSSFKFDFKRAGSRK